MADYHGKNIVIAGLGITGLSCVDFFLARGITPRVTDSRVVPPGIDKLPDSVPRQLGELYQPWLLAADLIIASPGIALAHPALLMAVQAGVEIIGDIELFCRHARAPIVAITGSNGKSTVTSLVGAMAQATGLNVAVGGNLGLPALRLLAADCQLYVLELSSFQLETTYSLRAAAACVLNVSDDHMDRYPRGFAQYRAAKLRIYQHAAVCVINADDPATEPEAAAGNQLHFGVTSGEYRLWQQRDECWLMAYGAKLVNTRDMLLTGQHNYTNALAALALTDALNIPRVAALAALATFRGLEHRFQLVCNKGGVRWINDSKATNVGSTLAALQGLQVSGKLHLLLGGDGKSADFSPLKPWVQNDAVYLYCYGRDRQQLMALHPRQAQQTETLYQAMKLIAMQVKAGDMVLLSPACASLDQFKNFAQRGEEFTRLAQELS